MTPFDRHVFVCLHQRPEGDPRGSCAPKGSAQVLDLLKGEVHRRGLEGVRVQRAGCLDQCEKGVSVVVYPEATWYGRVAPADCAEIVERHLVGGNPVERLRTDKEA